MIAAAQARQSLEQLGLAEAAAVLDGRLEAASQKQLPYADFLADLLSTETAARRERYLRTRTRLAHLPFQRTLDQFDFRFQPSIDKRQVRDLATLTFISEAARKLPRLVDSSRLDFPGPRRCPCESHDSRRARSSAS